MNINLDEIERHYDDEPGDLGDVTVALYDAIVDYIRATTEVAHDWFRDGEDEDADGILRYIEKWKAILKEIETIEVCCNLHGFIKRK